MKIAPFYNRRGSAMVAVFWLMSILALAVFSTVRVVSHDVDVVATSTHGSLARHYAEMGIAMAAHPRVEPGDPLLSQTFNDGVEGFSARITSEGRLFNINALIRREADREVLERIFVEWGMEPDDATALLDALIDWTDANDLEQLNGAERDYYEAQGQPNFPYNRYFHSLEEVRLVRGMADLEQLKPDWQKWFTPFNEGKLNVNEAEPELIAVAADVTYETALGLVDRVKGPDGIRYTEDDAPFQSVQQVLTVLGISGDAGTALQNRFATRDNTTRLESVGYATGAKQKITLVLRNKTGTPTIIQRMEEIVP